MSLLKINILAKIGFFRNLDLQLARTALQVDPPADENVLLAVALASKAVGEGHVCINLNEYAGRSWKELAKEFLAISNPHTGVAEEDEQIFNNLINKLYGDIPAERIWQKKILDSLLAEDSASPKNKRALFVLSGSHFYLRRYWNYEKTVCDKLKEMNTPLDRDVDEKFVELLFKNAASEQKAAARKACLRRLSVLSGGPGTGKTYTIARILALLARQNKNINIKLAAPTGKAAVRMVESIRDAKQALSDSKIEGIKELLTVIPEEASTIHRLLGSRANSPYFKHNASNPLGTNMIIIDEASMIDLPLMAKLLEAIPKECSLMLVGDVDQLSSVEPGRVYRDICDASHDKRPLAGSLTTLALSRRFPEDSVIGRLSRQINAGDQSVAWKTLIDQKDSPDLKIYRSTELYSDHKLAILVKDHMECFLKAKDSAEALDAAGKFRILCALRKGPYGVQKLNRFVEETLKLDSKKRFYDHQLVMVTVNTPSLNLYNGDVGVVLNTQEDSELVLKAYFPNNDYGAQERTISIPVNLLPEHETAFAMTVHKSQGSEFPYVALILPDRDSPVLTRELLYTGITRVKITATGNDGGVRDGRLYLWCEELIFKSAVERRTARVTGLFN